MSSFIDRFATLSLQGLSSLFRLIPRGLSLFVLSTILKLFILAAPKHKRIALKNFEIAFPDLSEQEKNRLYEEHLHSLARLLYDSLILKSYDSNWAEGSIDFPNKALHEKLKHSSETGILIATGHLGSFELLAHSAALMGFPLSYVVRNFALPKLDAWWCSEREKSGNRVIRRKGAYKEILKELKGGRDVGILFDQNVTRNHATFVPWFKLEAATTKAVALAVLQVKCPLVVAALCYKKRASKGRGCKDGNSYELLYEECKIGDVVENENLSKDEKVAIITERASSSFTKMIKKYPAQWFWMHRRWKTRPEEGDLDYAL